MGEMIRMTMDDGAEIAVYHVQPEGERRGGLVLVQEIFGVTDHIRELCDEYAADGYEVLSPAIFDREHRGFESDYSGAQFERAVQLARELHPFERSLKDAQTCIDALKGKGPVFITGYCYGGSVAWRMAQISPDLAAASAYYGSLIPTQFADQAPACATIAHFGRFDAGIPMEGVEALIAKAHPTAQIFVYDANHGFNSDRRKDYHEPSSEQARERTLMLFKACGGERSAVKIAINLLLFLLVFALAATAILYTQQRRMLFPAPGQYPAAPPLGFRLVHTQTGDGLRLAAFHHPAAPGKKTLLFFHGNGDNLLGAIQATRGPASAGAGLLLVEYRGYGGNPGSPDEAGLYEDGEAAMRWLAEAGVAPRDIVVVGNSVGSGPATEMALRHDVAALILVSGFSSLPEVVRSQVPLIPGWLVRDPFDNVAKLPRVKAPVFLMHGDADILVKPDNLARLRAARRDATVVLVAGVGHELAYGAPAQAILTGWVEGLH